MKKTNLENFLSSNQKEWPNLKLIQIYGMTEASGNVCFNHDKDTFAGKVCPGVELKVDEFYKFKRRILLKY